MIYTEYGTYSTCIFTLREKSISCNPSYLFKISDKDTKADFTFTASNITDSRYYDRFEFYVGNTSSIIIGATAGYVDAPASQYRYEIHEIPNGLTGLTNSIGIVETGIWQITGTHTPIPEYNQLNTPVSVYRNKDRV